MNRIVLTFGLISGLLIAAWTVASIAYCYSTGNFQGSMAIGYAAMLLAFSLVYVGVRRYRDEVHGGLISFGKALQTGLMISLVASTIYVIAWMIDYYIFIPDFMDKFTVAHLEQLKQSGATLAQINAQSAEMIKMKEMYKNPVWVVLFTYLEIMPVAILVPLVSALLLKRKNRLSFESSKN